MTIAVGIQPFTTPFYPTTIGSKQKHHIVLNHILNSGVVSTTTTTRVLFSLHACTFGKAPAKLLYIFIVFI